MRVTWGAERPSSILGSGPVGESPVFHPKNKTFFQQITQQVEVINKK